jgi:hypothetical protein
MTIGSFEPAEISTVFAIGTSLFHVRKVPCAKVTPFETIRTRYGVSRSDRLEGRHFRAGNFSDMEE